MVVKIRAKMKNEIKRKIDRHIKEPLCRVRIPELYDLPLSVVSPPHLIRPKYCSAIQIKVLPSPGLSEVCGMTEFR